MSLLFIAQYHKKCTLRMRLFLRCLIVSFSACVLIIIQNGRTLKAWTKWQADVLDQVDLPEVVAESGGKQEDLFPKPLQERYQYQQRKLRNEEEQAAADAECGLGPDYAKFFAQSSSQHSRVKEDEHIYNMFFKNRETDENNPRFYVEIGGFDGKTESNSRFFDVCLGWYVE